MTRPTDELSQALSQFLDPRGRTDIRFGLDRIKSALAAVDNPQDKIPPAIHVAGTNGKGSVAAFLRFMAEACGLGAHVFTSPHLQRVNERIRISGRLVEDAELVDVLDRVYETGVDLTYFEALTAAAFVLFARTRADLSIIEVGAGGKLDSTNVMKRPAVCAITQIARDHEKMFGTTSITEIARTKAGVMRAGVPVVIMQQHPRPLEALLAAAKAVRAPVLLEGEHWTANWAGDAFVYEDERGQVRAPWLGLAGEHQRANAGVACAALRSVAGLALTPEAQAAGLRETSWPARLQTLASGPITRDLKAPVVIDGAHNPAGAATLAAEMARREAPGRRNVVIFAAQGAKDVTGILKAIAPETGYFIACPLPSAGQEGGAGEDPHALSLIAEDFGMQASAAASIEDAFKLAAAADPGVVYVCGSLYLAGKVLEMNDERID